MSAAGRERGGEVAASLMRALPGLRVTEANPTPGAWRVARFSAGSEGVPAGGSWGRGGRAPLVGLTLSRQGRGAELLFPTAATAPPGSSAAGRGAGGEEERRPRHRRRRALLHQRAA